MSKIAHSATKLYQTISGCSDVEASGFHAGYLLGMNAAYARIEKKLQMIEGLLVKKGLIQATGYVSELKRQIHEWVSKDADKVP